MTDADYPYGLPPFWRRSGNATADGYAYGCDDINDCASNPCRNGGACTDGGTNIADCACAAGGSTDEELWGGATCENDVDECAAGQHNCASSAQATCINTDGSFICKCNDGWDGDGRDTGTLPSDWSPTGTGTYSGCVDYDDCGGEPCVNGNCTNFGDGTGLYKCLCQDGWEGSKCNKDTDECTLDSYTSQCDDDAECLNTRGSWACVCNQGYTGDGFNCVDADDCEFSPCYNSGVCEDCGELCYVCDCTDGWAGDRCDQDWNECELGIHQCHDDALCTNSVGSYECECAPGFSGDGYDFCNDVDNCLVWYDTDLTAENASAPWDDDGSLTAFGNGTDVTPCGIYDNSTSPTTFKQTGQCEDLPHGQFICTCEPGYSDKKCDNNINECARGNDACSPNAVCTDTAGSHTCSCNQGFTGDGVLCSDIDDCVYGIYFDITEAEHALLGYNLTDTLNQTNVTWSCQNGECQDRGVFDFNCECYDGWQDRLCDMDVDECSTGTHDCAELASCTNTVGSHVCTCNAGATGDGVTCEDVDDCADAPCENGVCNDHGPTSYSCTCDDGWTDYTCDYDINECYIGSHTCDPEARCINQAGGYFCRCLSGWAGDGFTCTDLDDCDPDPCAPGQGECHDAGANVYTCACKPGWCGYNCDENCDECKMGTHTCDPNSQCFDSYGSFNCACDDEYYGDGSVCGPCTECNSGYEEDTSKPPCDAIDRTCLDVDECGRVGMNNCDENAKCINSEGSFACLCDRDDDGNRYWGQGIIDRCYACQECGHGEYMVAGGDCSATENRECQPHVANGNYALESLAGARTQCLRKSKEELQFYPDRYNWGGENVGECDPGDSVCGVCPNDALTPEQNLMKGMEAVFKFIRLTHDKYIILNRADGLGWRCLGFRPAPTDDGRAEAYPRMMTWKDVHIGNSTDGVVVGYWDEEEKGPQEFHMLYDPRGHLRYHCGFRDVDGMDAKQRLLEDGAAVWRVVPLGCEGKYCSSKTVADKYVLMSGVNGDIDADGDIDDDDYECMYFSRNGQATHPSLVPRSPDMGGGVFGYGNTDVTAAHDCGIAVRDGQTQEEALLEDKSAVFRLIELPSPERGNYERSEHRRR